MYFKFRVFFFFLISISVCNLAHFPKTEGPSSSLALAHITNQRENQFLSLSWIIVAQNQWSRLKCGLISGLINTERAWCEGKLKLLRMFTSKQHVHILCVFASKRRFTSRDIVANKTVLGKSCAWSFCSPSLVVWKQHNDQKSNQSKRDKG